MILRTPVAYHSDVKETTKCTGIFVTSASVILAVYFPTCCQPCIIQKNTSFNFCFYGPLKLLFDIFSIILYITLLQRDIVAGQFLQNFRLHLYYDIFPYICTVNGHSLLRIKSFFIGLPYRGLYYNTGPKCHLKAQLR